MSILWICLYLCKYKCSLDLTLCIQCKYVCVSLILRCCTCNILLGTCIVYVMASVFIFSQQYCCCCCLWLIIVIKYAPLNIIQINYFYTYNKLTTACSIWGIFILYKMYNVSIFLCFFGQLYSFMNVQASILLSS